MNIKTHHKLFFYANVEKIQNKMLHKHRIKYKIPFSLEPYSQNNMRSEKNSSLILIFAQKYKLDTKEEANDIYKQGSHYVVAAKQFNSFHELDPAKAGLVALISFFFKLGFLC